MNRKEVLRGLVRRVAPPLVIAACAASGGLVSAQPVGIDPAAQALLRRSTDFLGAQQHFAAETRSSIEVVLVSGQKLQFVSTVSMAVRRPDRLWAKRSGDLVDQVFFYDGESLTLHAPRQKAYATVPAPASLEPMLDLARTRLDVVAPLGDFLYRNAYDILTDGVRSGFVVGKSTIEGVRCDHIAFSAPHADWQIWIEDGARPLPRKIVITSRDIVNAPQFDVTVTAWDLSPPIDDARFRFQAPAGESRVEFLPPAIAPASR